MTKGRLEEKMDDKKTGIKQNLTNYGDLGFSTFLRKSFIKGLGYSDEMLDKPIVGIINTFSDYNSCHGNVPDLIQSVRAGVLAKGAIPLEFPTILFMKLFLIQLQCIFATLWQWIQRR